MNKGNESSGFWLADVCCLITCNLPIESYYYYRHLLDEVYIEAETAVDGLIFLHISYSSTTIGPILMSIHELMKVLILLVYTIFWLMLVYYYIIIPIFIGFADLFSLLETSATLNNRN